MLAGIAHRFCEFLKAEEGPTAVEYAVLLGLIIVAGQVVNISRGGLRILSCQRTEPGTAFRIGIADGNDGLFTLLMARVVYIASAPGGQWFVGCTFTPKLREEILVWMQSIGKEE